jgi:sulfopyruvate decarboxylase TPP-binding subunit
MFSGEEIASLLERLGVTHVVTVPDSTIGPWQSELERRRTIRVVRVCREGETWQVAAGLHLGGAVPLVLIQCTGLFESGDAIRNALHDWKLPILSMIGYRSYLNQDNLPGDTCLVFTEPTLDAWRIPYRLITRRDQMPEIEAHYRAANVSGAPGSVVIAEGRS